jgi:anti-sigma B factor antagonist
MTLRGLPLRVYQQEEGSTMKINEYVGNNVVIIEPHGRLTLETVHYFRRAVAKRIDQGWSRLIVDLQDVHYMDSAGLGALAHAYTSCTRRGARLVLVRVFGKNRELLRITRLLTVFEVYETTLEAERSFARQPEATVM